MNWKVLDRKTDFNDNTWHGASDKRINIMFWVTATTWDHRDLQMWSSVSTKYPFTIYKTQSIPWYMLKVNGADYIPSVILIQGTIMLLEMNVFFYYSYKSWSNCIYFKLILRRTSNKKRSHTFPSKVIWAISNERKIVSGSLDQSCHLFHTDIKHFTSFYVNHGYRNYKIIIQLLYLIVSIC